MAGTERTLDALTGRLDRLERENRRLKRAGLVVLAGIAAVVLMGQARTAGRVVEAERFVLLDPSGRARGALAALEDGQVGLYLYDRGEKTRVELSVQADGMVGLRLFDRDENTRASLIVGAGGTPSLGLFDRDEKAAAMLIVGAGGTPSLAFHDKEEKTRVSMTLFADGGPTLRFFDKDKTIRAALGYLPLETTRTGAAQERPASSLVLFDKAGKVIWRAP